MLRARSWFEACPVPGLLEVLEGRVALHGQVHGAEEAGGIWAQQTALRMRVLTPGRDGGAGELGSGCQ